ncbi:cleft lip and palate transmembrane protein 1-domain-containing protein [Cunninghamella echinulata]|nr:cleft lip and palate transmembrane protein 1-domain-containing protein [Cunninghamella echinulata]
MPEPTAANPGGGGQQPNQQQNQSFFAKYGSQVLHMLVIWTAIRFITNGLMSNNSNNAPAPVENSNNNQGKASLNYNPNGGNTLRDYAINVPDNVYYFTQPDIPLNQLADSFAPLWPKKASMDLFIYTSENEYFTNYHDKPIWHAENLIYGENQNDKRELHVDIPVTKTLQNNGTLYAHIFMSLFNSPIDPKDPAFEANNVAYSRHLLTKYYPKKTVVKQKNLLNKVDDNDDTNAKVNGNEEEKEEDVEIVEETIKTQQQDQNQKSDAGVTGFGLGLLSNLTRQAPLVAYWHENVTLTIVSEVSIIPKQSMQPPVIKHIRFDDKLSRDDSGKFGFYKPIVYPNDFWLLRSNAYPINETLSTLPLIIHLEPISMWKFNIYATMTDAMNGGSTNPMGGISASETDEVKRMFLETNPVLLGVTICVSLLHSLFEMLAFKNDIAFWKKKDNSSGVSVRSLFVNIFFQAVIFLYLLDNNQETSWMILIERGIGVLIEIWKVLKALKYELKWQPGQLIPTLASQPHDTTEEEDETAKYDAIAFKYLTWLSYPLLVGYAIYSLLYDEHKSWYSFVLKTLVEFVYLFGFITMIPQLYINYRLKSVAHMPWKSLMYKSLNTFIDDLFAFVIKMPTLHRIACLRDDAVFIVYLYQRYKYKTDHSRANEFGQVGEIKEDKKELKDEKESKKESKKDK